MKRTYAHKKKNNWNMLQLEMFVEKDIEEDSEIFFKAFCHGMVKCQHKLIHAVGEHRM